MINFISFNNTKSDIIGASASALCLLHCIATPFLFLAHAGIDHHHSSPFWWQIIDVLFLTISFFAVYRSNQTTSKNWVGRAMWISWGVLVFIIFNEKLELFHIPEIAVFFPAISLILLHLYNQRYCNCSDDCIH